MSRKHLHTFEECLDPILTIENSGLLFYMGHVSDIYQSRIHIQYLSDTSLGCCFAASELPSMQVPMWRN